MWVKCTQCLRQGHCWGGWALEWAGTRLPWAGTTGTTSWASERWVAASTLPWLLSGSSTGEVGFSTSILHFYARRGLLCFRSKCPLGAAEWLLISGIISLVLTGMIHFSLTKWTNLSYCSVQCGFGHSEVQGMCYLHCNSCSNALSKCLGKQTLFLSIMQRSIIVLSPKGAVVVFGSYSLWSSEEGSQYFCASTPMNFAFVLLIIHWVNPHLKLTFNYH